MRSHKLTFVFFILHLSQAFQTLLCLPSPISGLLLPLGADADDDAAVTLFAPLGPGFELLVRLDDFLCVTSLSVEGGEGRDGGCDGGGIFAVVYVCFIGKMRLWTWLWPVVVVDYVGGM